VRAEKADAGRHDRDAGFKREARGAPARGQQPARIAVDAAFGRDEVSMTGRDARHDRVKVAIMRAIQPRQ
jgi:hypothetical protein